MSYQVLARKWRPKNFQELQGQEHVSRALINAIEAERLHHAYLFTGTRGVGKTTIARILSKCLNCETNGLTAQPCGECASCVEIDEGRFVDLIEVDAASRTKVDDTRELLDNVQYRPTRGRYKVYLIDEVHMLSNSSFNALLKTLEEPPEHVIFLLATTDPQKLPITVLSRCLQFHLKHMDEETINKHLNYILEQENIDFEAVALSLIAQSAEGSMRDALSLLDQAIAFGQGAVNEADIRSMLGTIDHQFMSKLLDALVAKDPKMAITTIEEMSHYPVDFADALKELLSRLHQTAIFQATGVLLDGSAGYLEQYADQISAQDLQLYYQIGLHARRDMAWAANPKQGLEMALLRMLAFQIDSETTANSAGKKKAKLVSKPEPEKEESPIETVVEKTVQKPQNDQPVKTEATQAVAKEEVAVKHSDAGYDYSDYHWGEEEATEDASQSLKPFSATTTAEQATHESLPQAEKHIEAAETGADTKKPDPVASLHAALGLTTSTAVAETVKTESRADRIKKDVSEKVEVVPSFNKSIEDELEETTKQPIDIVEDSSFVEDTLEELTEEKPEDINLATSLVAGLQASSPAQEEIEQVSGSKSVIEPAETDDEWANLVVQLDLTGTLEQITHSSLLNWQGQDKIAFSVNPKLDLICTDSAKAGIEEAVIKHFDRRISFEWSFEEPDRETPAMIFERLAKEKHEKACKNLEKHPFSQELAKIFNAQLMRESVGYLN